MTERRKINIGDRVILKEAVIIGNHQGSVKGHYQIEFDDKTITSVYGCQIETVLPKPWEPTVGNEVIIDTIYSRVYVYEIKAIDGDQACLKRLRRSDGKPLCDSNLGFTLSVCRLKDLALCVD